MLLLNKPSNKQKTTLFQTLFFLHLSKERNKIFVMTNKAIFYSLKLALFAISVGHSHIV